jgi:hypothetical protein
MKKATADLASRNAAYNGVLLQRRKLETQLDSFRKRRSEIETAVPVPRKA